MVRLPLVMDLDILNSAKGGEASPRRIFYNARRLENDKKNFFEMRFTGI